MLETFLEIDVSLLQFFNNWGNTYLDPFWLFITKVYIWVPLILFLFFKASKSEPLKVQLILLIGLLVLLAVILGLTDVVKNMVERIRPCNNPLLEGCFREPIHPSDFSFFSGHTASSFGIAVYCIKMFKSDFKWIYIILIWAVFFSYSRLYLAAHFPSDIFIGGFVGCLLALLLVNITEKCRVKYS